ncbi:MAG: hypothetical protein JXR68_14090 [Bacteroidales bacterium]|nr:hypothetical protein [Bacteroidales bacterium]
MKNKFTVITLLFALLFASCEGPIYHNFVVVNKTNKSIDIKTQIKNYDSVSVFSILPDSSAVILQNDEMQGFFSGKLDPLVVSDIFEKIIVLNDTIFDDFNFAKDTSLWQKEYVPGSYIYTLNIK